MNPDLPTQLPANVDNAPAALGAARYPQANNCMDKSYAASNTKFKTRPDTHRLRFKALDLRVEVQ
jgi:hypothetical protein